MKRNSSNSWYRTKKKEVTALSAISPALRPRRMNIFRRPNNRIRLNPNWILFILLFILQVTLLHQLSYIWMHDTPTELEKGHILDGAVEEEDGDDIATLGHPNTIEYKQTSFQCKCIDCEEDEICGGLWKATKFPGMDEIENMREKKIHIIVSHCKNNLDWISSFIQGFENVYSIHVISKCGSSATNVPNITTFQVLPNVGRCDHTYAYYIASQLDQRVTREDQNSSIIVFLKDDISLSNNHQGGKWINLESMIRLVSSTNGFACGSIPGNVPRKRRKRKISMSAYHELDSLQTFSKTEYVRNEKEYGMNSNGVTRFKSNYANLEEYHKTINGIEPLPEIVQVCYGGVFAASVQNIKKIKMSIWKKIEKDLTRGDNIEEGHYMERSWASLLSTPLQPFQIDALRDYSDSTANLTGNFVGTLLRHRRWGTDVK